MNRVLSIINLSVIVFLLFLGGCHDKDIYKDENTNLTTNDVFNFSTRQEVNMSLNYTVPVGYRVYFEVYKENPLAMDEYGNYLRNDAKPIAIGHTKDNGGCDVTLSIASYVETLYVYSPNIGVPRILEGKIENGKVKIANESTSTVQKQRLLSRVDTPPYYTNWITQQLTWLENADLVTYNTSGELTSPLEKIEINADHLDHINATIPEGEQLDMRYSQLSEIALSKDAEVRIYYVSNTAERENALAYYTFTDGDMEGLTPNEKQAYINSRLILLFPRLSTKTLSPGDGVQLKYWDGSQLKTTFPAGSKIGFVLLINAWKDGNVATSTKVMYSDKACNSYTIPDVAIMGDRPQMASFMTRDNYFILSFEDQPWSESPKYPQYHGDFRNNIFVLHANPASALPDVPPGEDVVDKPIPGVEMYSEGTLAFEDIWPYKGDYDMNDVVVEYNVTDYFDMENYEYSGFEGDFTFVNNGAQYTNGFGIQLPSDRANIKSCTITSTYKYAKQGMDEDLDQGTIMLFDNGKIVPKNTKFHVRVEYIKGKGPNGFSSAAYQKIARAPYNPFITIDDNGEKRKEVHLVNYLPTPKADEELLHYGHDLSNPTGGVYYVSDAKFPFAIDIAGALGFKTPGEAIRIDQMYPKFVSWVASDGKEDKDWYK